MCRSLKSFTILIHIFIRSHSLTTLSVVLFPIMYSTLYSQFFFVCVASFYVDKICILCMCVRAVKHKREERRKVRHNKLYNIHIRICGMFGKCKILFNKKDYEVVCEREWERNKKSIVNILYNNIKDVFSTNIHTNIFHLSFFFRSFHLKFYTHYYYCMHDYV